MEDSLFEDKKFDSSLFEDKKFDDSLFEDKKITKSPNAAMTALNEFIDTATLNNAAEAKAALDTGFGLFGDRKALEKQYEAELLAGRSENPKASMAGSGAAFLASLLGGKGISDIAAKSLLPNASKAAAAATAGGLSGLSMGLLSDLGADKGSARFGEGLLNAAISAPLSGAASKVGDFMTKKSFAKAISKSTMANNRVNPSDFIDEINLKATNPEDIYNQLAQKQTELAQQRASLLAGNQVNIPSGSFDKTESALLKLKSRPQMQSDLADELMKRKQILSGLTPIDLENERALLYLEKKGKTGPDQEFYQNLYEDIKDLMAKNSSNPELVKDINAKRSILFNLKKNQQNLIGKEAIMSPLEIGGLGIGAGAYALDKIRQDKSGESSAIPALSILGSTIGSNIYRKQSPSMMAGRLIRAIPEYTRRIPISISNEINPWNLEK